MYHEWEGCSSGGLSKTIDEFIGMSLFFSNAMARSEENYLVRRRLEISKWRILVHLRQNRSDRFIYLSSLTCIMFLKTTLNSFHYIWSQKWKKKKKILHNDWSNVLLTTSLQLHPSSVSLKKQHTYIYVSHDFLSMPIVYTFNLFYVSLWASWKLCVWEFEALFSQYGTSLINQVETMQISSELWI